MVEGWVFILAVTGLSLGVVAAGITALRFYLERRDATRDRTDAVATVDRLRRERDEAVRARRELEEAARATTPTPDPAAPAVDPEPSAEDLMGAWIDGIDELRERVTPEGRTVDLTGFTEAEVIDLEREAGPGTALAVPSPTSIGATVAEILAWKGRTEEEKRVLSLASRAADALERTIRQGLAEEADNIAGRGNLGNRAAELRRLNAARGTGVVPEPTPAPAIEEAVAEGTDDALLAEAERIVGGE